jgi:hypothetical protein|nr:MAG TPA: Protein of unknown function (DUF2634) [Caudoviricetes sp.]
MESVQSWQTIEKDRMIDVSLKKNIDLSNPLEKIRLRLENKLRLFSEEWFLHKNEGLYWIKRAENAGQIGEMLQKFNIESQIRETILSDKDVDSILKFKNNFVNSTGNYTFEVEILLKTGEILNF